MGEQATGRPPTVQYKLEGLSKANQKALQGWENYLLSRRLKHKSVKEYRFFLVHLLFSAKKDYSTITKNDLNAFIIERVVDPLTKTTKISSSSQKTLFSALNSFFVDHLGRTELVLKRKAIRGYTQAPKIRDKIFRYDEMQRFFQGSILAGKKMRQKQRVFNGGLKVRAMFALGYGAGLRINEMIELKTACVNFKESTLTLMASKGKEKPETQEVFPEFMAMAEQYAKSTEFNKGFEYFFSYKKPETGELSKYNAVMVGKLFWDALDEAGMSDKRKARSHSFHSLRHSVASHMIDMGYKIPQVKKFLRHAQKSTVVMEYIHSLDDSIKGKRSPASKMFKKGKGLDNL